MKRPVPALVAVLLAPIAAPASAIEAPPTTSPRDAADPTPAVDERLAPVLVTIQNTCFAAYPDELVARMSGRPGPPPDAVRADPQARIDYLKTEALVSKGLFYPTRLEEIVPALRASLRRDMRLLDLGSGDGRVVFLAAHLGARATGIEYDPELHRVARRARARLARIVDTGRAELMRGDFFEIDLAAYDMLFYFGSGTFAEDRLFRKIAREMREDALFLLAYPPAGSIAGLARVGSFGVVQLYRPAARAAPGP